MYPKSSEMGFKSKKNSCDINITKTAAVENGRSPLLDVEISGGWSMKPTRKQQIVDQLFHFSVFFCLIILACYIISIHTLLYYETQDTASLKTKVDYAYTLNKDLASRVQSLEFSLDTMKKDLSDLKSEFEKDRSSCEQNPTRRKRSVVDQNEEYVMPRKKNRHHRTRTMENVAIHFTALNPPEYELEPAQQAILGPWISDMLFGRNEEAFGVSYQQRERYVQINRAGLYFIYAQVTYGKSSNIGSFSINVINPTNTTDETSNNPIASCSVDLRDVPFDLSCFTSTVRVLNPRDIIYLEQISINTTITFDNDTTFFGMILLSEA